jgi:hypothetical protein
MRKHQITAMAGSIALTMLLPCVGLTGIAAADEESRYEVFLGVWDVVAHVPTGPVEGVLTCEVVDGELVITEESLGRATEVSAADNALSFVFEIDGVRHNVVAEVDGDTLDGKVFVGGTSFCNYEDMYELSGSRRT